MLVCANGGAYTSAAAMLGRSKLAVMPCGMRPGIGPHKKSTQSLSSPNERASAGPESLVEGSPGASMRPGSSACRLVRNIKRACIAGARRRRSTHRRVVARVSSHARELHPRVVCSAVYILCERALLRAETRASNVHFPCDDSAICTFERLLLQDTRRQAAKWPLLCTCREALQRPCLRAARRHERRTCVFPMRRPCYLHF